MVADLDSVGIEMYARRLKEAYLTLRRMTRPDSYGLGARHDDAINRVAAALYYRKGSPFGYMQYAFDKASEFGSDTSYTGIFLSDKMVNRYFMDRKSREDEIRLLLSLQSAELERRLNEGDTLRVVLLDPSAQLSAAFRLAAAMSAGDTELAGYFAAEACELLLFEPIYRELLGKWLPEDLKDDRSLLTKYFSRDGVVHGTPPAKSEGVPAGEPTPQA